MATPASIIDHDLPTVVLVGRVNVGKSTLFNRLTETNHALVSDIAGTTRTRNVGYPVWRGKQFRLIDTGGLTFSEEVPLEKEIISQTEIALKEADVVVMVVDIQTGLLPQEKELVRLLKSKVPHKPILLIANKTDSARLKDEVHNREWLALNLGTPFPVSAASGNNLGDLLDRVYALFKTLKRTPRLKKEIEPVKIALMGRPNVGKSSLFNKLIGEERVIVSPVAHTTREPHDTLVDTAEYGPLLFIDTAGIRRKTKVAGELEKIGINKSIQSIDRADIVLLILDATEPITDQDQQLAGLLREHSRSVILVVNKWDQAEDNSDESRNETKKMIYSKFPHLDFAPIVFVSAKTSYRVHDIFPAIAQAAKERLTTIDPEILRAFIQRVVKKHRPARGKGVRHPQITDFIQINAGPPIFELFIKFKTSLHFSYVHYLENRLREEFGFYAAPIIIKLTKIAR